MTDQAYIQQVEKQNSQLQYIIHRLEEDIRHLESKIYINPRDVMSIDMKQDSYRHTSSILSMSAPLPDSMFREFMVNNIDPYYTLTLTLRLDKNQLEEIQKSLYGVKWGR